MNISDREHRLRSRIDQLLDEREHLRAQTADRRRLVRRIWELTRSRDAWRRRALRR
jgi:hypothetical protein